MTAGESAKAEPKHGMIQSYDFQFHCRCGASLKDEPEVIAHLDAALEAPPAAERTALAKDIRTYMALNGWASTKKALKKLREAKERLEAFAYENDPEGRVIIYTGTDSPKLKKLVKNAVEIDASEGTKSE